MVDRSVVTRRAFLFLVNPALHYDPAEDWREWLPRTQSSERYSTSWNTGSRRRGIETGDLAVLVKVGVHPKGVIAVGTLTSSVYEAPHWNPEARSVMTGWADVSWHTLLPLDAPIPLELLRGVGPHVRWTPRMSGTEIPYDVGVRVREISRAWAPASYDVSAGKKGV